MLFLLRVTNKPIMLSVVMLNVVAQPGENLKTVFGRVFNSKIGSFAAPRVECMAGKRPLLELKPQTRFGPVS